MADSAKRVCEEADDLEYHITFPSPVPPAFSDQHDGEEDEEPSASFLRPKPEPVVILLGWMACEDRHLTKYSDFYVKKSCITIRYTADTQDLFRPDNTLRTIATKILELIVELDLKDSPIFFHVFSNGGCFIYHHISQVLHSNKSFSAIRVKGCIFDSCPIPRTLRNAANALITALPLNAVVKYMISAAVIFCLAVMSALHWLAQFVGWQLDSGSNYWSDMEEDKARWPQLFLYSQADKLVDFKCIKRLIEHRKKLGVDVSSLCWHDSPHVNHFKCHRETYVQQCYDFLDKCLDQD